MRVVDTSAWIEWIVGSELGDVVHRQFPDYADWIVPTMVQLELVKWTTRVLGAERAGEILALTQTLDVIPMDTPIAVRAAGYSMTHRLPMADSVIYATARELKADLLTCDAHFEGLEKVLYVPK
ncbi:MAG TPA: type II toxin-antitoxin system VapC family toxin [Devosia sp.]|nr:type II toxin-antitoxin system VapC family toxin [Devosia sp.]